MSIYRIDTDGTPHGTRIWNAQDEEITADTYRIVIDTSLPRASVHLSTFAKNADGKKFINDDGEAAREELHGTLVEINGRRP